MILYFADRKMEILGQAATNLPGGFKVFDDNKIEDTDTGIATFSCYISYTDKNRAQLEAMTNAGNYLLRSEKDERGFFTIIDSEINTKDKEIFIYAEDAGLDLINEVAEAFEAPESHNAVWYIEKYTYDSGFVIGINEIPATQKAKLKWEGEESVTSRLASIATQFGGYEISYSFEVKGLTVLNKFINIHKKRGIDAGVTLYLNRDIDKIVTSKSVANLATAFLCVGGVPDNKDEPITFSNTGYKYDDGDFFVDGDKLKSRKANEKWSRYVWNKEPNKVDEDGGYIVRPYSYNTTDPATLKSHAVTELKKICDMEINYEVDIKRLPEGVRIGDRINIVDDAGGMYVSARILKLETSVANREHKATLGESLIKSSEISRKVVDLAERFAIASQSWARALNVANNAAGNAVSAAETATAKAEGAETAAESASATAAAAKAAADIAAEEAAEARVQADKAQASAEEVRARADGAQLDAERALNAADEAQAAADKAQADVDSLAVRVTTAETKIGQNSEQIALMATKTEVATTLGGYYTKTETDAAIKVKADAITSSVSSTYATKQEVGNIKIGGRNLLRDSTDLSVFSMANGITSEKTEEGFLRFVAESGNGSWASFKIGSNYEQVESELSEGDKYVISFTMRSPDSTALPRIYIKSGMGYYSLAGQLSSEWSTVYYAGTWKDANNITAHLGFSGCVGTYEIKNCKIEKGNKATDWTPAPEDVDEAIDDAQTTANQASETATSANERITTAESLIQQLSNCIAMLVTDENGESLMTQTADGWTFSMKETNEAVAGLISQLEAVRTESGSTTATMDLLRQAVIEHGTRLQYVNVTTYEGEPCIELGKSDSEFKLMITNTRIMFVASGGSPTHINTRGLVTENIEVKGEIVQGGYVMLATAGGGWGLIWKGEDN